MADQIRPATEADSPVLAELIRAAFAEYAGRLDPPSSAHAKTAEVVRQELAGGGAFLALVEDAAAGCVLYHPHHDYVYLNRLAVLPQYRQRGLGRRLIAAVEAEALARGLGEVRLSVRLSLAAQRASYERLGYTFLSYGTHAGYAAPTFVRLRKVLEITP